MSGFESRCPHCNRPAGRQRSAVKTGRASRVDCRLPTPAAPPASTVPWSNGYDERGFSGHVIRSAYDEGMRPKVHEQRQAQLMRENGRSIKEIAQALGVSQGSVSLWVRGIHLDAAQVSALRENQRAGCRRMNDARREILRERYEDRRREGYALAAQDDRFRTVCALYWGEGSKANQTFCVSNSDPALLKIVLDWLARCGYGDRIRFYLSYYPDNGLTEDDIKKWWLGQLPKLRGEHFGTCFVCRINRASQRKGIGKLPYGTAQLHVCSAELFYLTMGGIDYLKDRGG